MKKIEQRNGQVLAVIGLGTKGITVQGDLESFKLSPFGCLVEDLEFLGHSVVSPNSPSLTHYVSLNFNAKELASISHQVVPEKRILIVQEPSIILPGNYSRKRVKQFAAGIISFNPETSTQYLPWPQIDWIGENLPLTPVQFSSRSVSLINSNKISLFPGSNYGFRRKIMSTFGASEIPIFVAGPGWDNKFLAQFKSNMYALLNCIRHFRMPKFSEISFTSPSGERIRYVGKVEDKYRFANKHPFAIVVENSSTYISEKLFDAVLSGVVPLFHGPDLASFGIPDGIAIELGPDPQEFLELARSLTPEKYRAYTLAGQSWITSRPAIENWSGPNALNRLAKQIDSKITSTRS